MEFIIRVETRLHGRTVGIRAVATIERESYGGFSCWSSCAEMAQRLARGRSMVPLRNLLPHSRGRGDHVAPRGLLRSKRPPMAR